MRAKVVPVDVNLAIEAADFSLKLGFGWVNSRAYRVWRCDKVGHHKARWTAAKVFGCEQGGEGVWVPSENWF